MPYRPRLVDDLLDQYCSDVPAVVLSGARAVGKSATAERRANTIFFLEDPDELALLLAKPDALTAAEPPVLIDEWRRWPASWDKVRRAVDADASPGRFLLTASAAPIEKPFHSGAGRFLFLQMRPMSLVERGLETPSVSLRDLLSGDGGEISGQTEATLSDYASEIMASGFPGVREIAARSRQAYLNGYLEASFSYAIGAGDEPTGHEPTVHDPAVHDPTGLRRWATSYAAATATTAEYETIRDGATGGEREKSSKPWALAVRRTLENAYVVDPLKAWAPTLNRLRRLGTAPKHHLTDPALAARLLGTNAQKLTNPGAPKQYIGKQRPLVGALFESLVAQSVRIYADYNSAETYHLRTHAGEREIDLIVERDDGGVVALDVKLVATPQKNDYRHLSWLKDRIGDRLLDAGVITTGKHAYREPNTGFAVIPAALLGP